MRKALVVGLDEYPTIPLKGCINDALSVSTLLKTDSDGSPNFDIRTITDVRTKGELRSMIQDLFRGSSDISLFYFSGHGFVNELGGYIVTLDYSTYDEGISMNDILTYANQSPSQEKIIILDCCHSGAMGNSQLNTSISNIGQGVTVLSASRAAESAMEINGHGIFTNLLIGALQGGAADLRGYITPGSVYSFIDQALGAWDQRPIFKTNVSRFTSLRKVSPPIQFEVLRELTRYFEHPTSQYNLDPSYEFTDESADEENVVVFKKLQKYASVGLVVPVDEEHMYFSAMNSKACKLTALGAHYWNLVKNNRV